MSAVYKRETAEPRYGWRLLGGYSRDGKSVYGISLDSKTAMVVSHRPDERGTCGEKDPSSCATCVPGWMVSKVDWPTLRDALTEKDRDKIVGLLIDGETSDIFRTARAAKVSGEKLLGITDHKPSTPRSSTPRTQTDPWRLGARPLLDGRIGTVQEITDEVEHQEDHPVCYWAIICTGHWDKEDKVYRLEKVGYATNWHHLSEADARAAIDAEFYPPNWRENIEALSAPVEYPELP